MSELMIEANDLSKKFGDVHALDLTEDPGSFIEMQRRLATTNISDPDPPRAWQWFFGSHPTLAERVAIAEDWAELRNP